MMGQAHVLHVKKKKKSDVKMYKSKMHKGKGEILICSHHFFYFFLILFALHHLTYRFNSF